MPFLSEGRWKKNLRVKIIISAQEAMESSAFPDEFMRKLKIFEKSGLFPALSDRAFFVK